MIVQEIFEDNPDLIRTYSSAGFKIMQVDTGFIYDEAIDIANTTNTYVETDDPIIDPDEEQDQETPQPDYYEGYMQPQDAIDFIFGDQE